MLLFARGFLAWLLLRSLEIVLRLLRALLAAFW